MSTDTAPSTSTSNSPFTFRFLIHPGEGDHLRETRWNQAVTDLANTGYTILGTGPDRDWPVRYEVVDPQHPEGDFYEIYDTVPLERVQEWLNESEVA